MSVRTTDPETSHEAAASIDKDRLEALVARTVKTAGDYGMTGSETAEALQMVVQTVSPRFAPLMAKGILVLARNSDGEIVKRMGKHRRKQQVHLHKDYAIK
jgi:hypothetical protein